MKKNEKLNDFVNFKKKLRTDRQNLMLSKHRKLMRKMRKLFVKKRE